jgi:hypothetical protein
VLDSQGNGIAVWNQWDSKRHSVWYSTYALGGEWTTPALVEKGELADTAEPRIVADASGSATVVWLQWEAGQNRLWTSTYVAPTGWSAPVRLENMTTGSVRYADVAINAQGTAAVVWCHEQTNQHEVYVARRVAGVWSQPFALDGGDYRTDRDASVAVGGSKIFVLWAQSDGTRYNVFNNYLSFTDTPSGPGYRIEFMDSGNAFQSTLVANEKDEALGVWTQENAAGTSVLFTNRDPNTGWFPQPTTLNPATVSETSNPRLVMDAQGNASAVWIQSDGTRRDIWANRFTAGKGWETAIRIEDNSAEPRDVDLVVDGQGHVMAAWVQSDGTYENIWANRYVPNKGWGTPAIIEKNDLGNAEAPALAADAQGNVVVMWHQLANSRYSVWQNRFE